MGGSSCNGVRQSGPGNEDDNNENELKCFLPLRFNPDLVLHVEQERFWPPLLLLGCSRVERSLLVLKRGSLDAISHDSVGHHSAGDM